jgi:uncharacterized membrane protein required for colicin V production
MPESFTWLDVIIALILVIFLLQGMKSGFIRSIFNVTGVIVGLLVAIRYYAFASGMLMAFMNMPQLIADTLCFITLFSLSSIAIQLVGSLFSMITRLKLIKVVDKAGGSLTGLLIGLALIGFVLIMLTAFPVYSGFQEQINQSTLALPIVEAVHYTYGELTGMLPFELPHIAFHPEDLSILYNNISNYSDHSGVNFRNLDGATCFVCGGAVEFLGFQHNDKNSVSPKFICSDCGRTSDGCQTYEGYHEMYGKCPVLLGKQGYRLDCGIWTNYSYHRPGGPCPVCGEE